jgi:uncharacterized protein YjbI with pentapeptide repeats
MMWNRWFLTHPGAWIENSHWPAGTEQPYPPIDINLSDGNFSKMCLDGIILDGAMLDRVNFYNTSLRNARLLYTSAKKACFFGADLRGCDLRLAGVEGSDLSYADLEGADVRSLLYTDKTLFRGARHVPVDLGRWWKEPSIGKINNPQTARLAEQYLKGQER